MSDSDLIVVEETAVKFNPMMKALESRNMNNHTDALTKQVFTLFQNYMLMACIVISPGSRSTPLAIAVEAHPKLKSWIHPDERSAAFLLGLMKGSERQLLCVPQVALLQTHPLFQSSLSHLPLVVLTSDRPHELRILCASSDQPNEYVSKLCAISI